MLSRPLFPLESAKITQVPLATCRALRRYQVILRDHVDDEILQCDVDTAGVCGGKINAWDLSQKVYACGRRPEEEEFVIGKGLGLRNDISWRPEKVERACRSLEIGWVDANQQIEIFGEARFGVNRDGPASDHEVFNART